MFEQPIRKLFDVGSIVYSPPIGAVPPFVNVKGGRNGTSLDAGNFIVLGQDDVGGAGAVLLSDRVIPTAGFFVRLQGQGPSLAVTTGDSVASPVPANAKVFIDMADTDTATRAITITGRAGTDSEALRFMDESDNLYLNLDVQGQGGGANFNNPTTGTIIELQTNLATNASVSIQKVNNDTSVGFADLPTLNLPVNGQHVSYIARPQGASNANSQIIGYSFVPSNTIGSGHLIAFTNQNGDCLFCTSTGNVSIEVSVPTARLHIVGSPDGSPGSGPLKLSVGTLVVTPEGGLLEFDGTHLYFTIGATRTIIV